MEDLPGIRTQATEERYLSVYWITGLAGAGKTTIAGLLYSDLKRTAENVVLLDGDSLRKILNDEINYDSASRNNLAMKYSRLCKYLSDQGIHVVIATIAMFHDVRRWNRENFSSYVEIYVKVPLETLKKRDQKGLYSSAESGRTDNVIGMNEHFEEPENPDLVLENPDSADPAVLLNQIKDYLATRSKNCN
jgi:adenylylsulfate kinase-like enzyme